MQWHLNRWYLPWAQRWASQDPIFPLSGSNPYEYCRNDPTDFVDPSGLDPEYGTLEWFRQYVSYDRPPSSNPFDPATQTAMFEQWQQQSENNAQWLYNTIHNDAAALTNANPNLSQQQALMDALFALRKKIADNDAAANARAKCQINPAAGSKDAIDAELNRRRQAMFARGDWQATRGLAEFFAPSPTNPDPAAGNFDNVLRMARGFNNNSSAMAPPPPPAPTPTTAPANPP